MNAKRQKRTYITSEPVAIRLRFASIALLRRLAKLEGRPMADIMEDAIADWMEKRTKECARCGHMLRRRVH